MKIAVLGAGGLGRIVALELASDPTVQELVLVDKRGDRSKALKSIGRAATVTPLQADIGKPAELRRILPGMDAVVNATLPEFNLAVMSACLDVGSPYIDCWGLSPLARGEKPGVLEQLAQDAAWRARGVTALISMGSDPGLSNIMARACANRLEEIREIRILKAAAGGGAIEGYPLYSRAVFLRDALAPPLVWEDGEVRSMPYVSGESDYTFPPPIGTRHVYQFYHEEVLTLPQRLGRPVGRVAYLHDINPDLVRAIASLDALGLLAEDKRVQIGTAGTTFRDAFLATFPEPSTLVGPVAGSMAIVVEARGTKPGGTKASIRSSIVVDHREANRRRGTTAERYVTAVAVAVAAALIRDKKAPRTGVLAPEELPLAAVLPEFASRGLSFSIEEFPA